MTYFNYRHIRCTRTDRVFVDSVLIGHVTTKIDWRERFSLADSITIHYRARRLNGDMLPRCYPSHHDAAEALYEAVHGTRTSSARDPTL